ncbi:DUF6438 domain-containing protein [Tenacibaculum maritimum]|uniref:DUF6438 domain-containing protein n=1 Tax=Tenacibaculum maritimum TaxID=107401 RepID=UPI0012E66F33|nr:DUF6438 domain-containing protein [Tenacibaculum maritimum]CAA0220769.1 conserved hypothetical protein [Tenacibaculum maritimum]
MKYITFLPLLIISFSCVSSKKTTTEERNMNNNITTTKIIRGELIAVVKNPKKMDEAKQLITNSGLIWDSLLSDQEDLAIVLIKVPVEKHDFWITRLIQSNTFLSVESNAPMLAKNIIEKAKNTLISLQKLPCYGKCPTYNLTIYNDGKAVYNGLENIAIKGEKTFQLTTKQFKELTKKITQKPFTSYQDSYDNPRIADLSTILISHGGKQIQIRLWNEVPDDLVAIYEYLEMIALDKKMYE